MALNATILHSELATSIVAHLAAMSPTLAGDTPAAVVVRAGLSSLAMAISSTIVAHIKSHAVVTVTGVASGVTTGSGTAPITGTGTIA